MDLEALPGGELVRKGLADLAERRESPESLLLEIGRPRLERLGLVLGPPRPEGDGFPEHRLYLLLASSDPRRAHSRYNALVRRLVSFERAARGRL
jgi:hypothetical protein